jgi:uncharacterized membrane protein
MNIKRLLIISWVVAILVIVAALLPFIIRFYSHTISDKQEHWGQFGDYFGGILNPIISLISLIVLTYISISVSKIEDQRNEFTLQELARPFGQIIYINLEQHLEIKFMNCGLGPLIIKEILLTNGKEIKSTNFYTNLPVSDNVIWRDFMFDGMDFTLARDSEIVLFSVTPFNANISEIFDGYKAFEDFKAQFRKIIKDFTIEIKYQDIYGRSMPIVSKSLSMFEKSNTISIKGK